MPPTIPKSGLWLWHEESPRLSPRFLPCISPILLCGLASAIKIWQIGTWHELLGNTQDSFLLPNVTSTDSRRPRLLVSHLQGAYVPNAFLFRLSCQGLYKSGLYLRSAPGSVGVNNWQEPASGLNHALATIQSSFILERVLCTWWVFR